MKFIKKENHKIRMPDYTRKLKIRGVIGITKTIDDKNPYSVLKIEVCSKIL